MYFIIVSLKVGVKYFKAARVLVLVLYNDVLSYFYYFCDGCQLSSCSIITILIVVYGGHFDLDDPTLY